MTEAATFFFFLTNTNSFLFQIMTILNVGHMATGWRFYFPLSLRSKCDPVCVTIGIK